MLEKEDGFERRKEDIRVERKMLEKIGGIKIRKKDVRVGRRMLEKEERC